MTKEKNKGGRPLKFKNPAELEDKIKEYFDRCDEWKMVTKIQNGVKLSMNTPFPYTVEGLCVYLDIDRKTLLAYQWEREWSPNNDTEFLHTVNKAKEKILQNLKERALMWENNAAVSIFNLKNNYGYKDQNQTELSWPEGTNPFWEVKINIIDNKTAKSQADLDKPNK